MMLYVRRVGGVIYAYEEVGPLGGHILNYAGAGPVTTMARLTTNKMLVPARCPVLEGTIEWCLDFMDTTCDRTSSGCVLSYANS